MPCDFRLYEKGGKTKNEHVRDMLDRAAERGFAPEMVLFDSWYRGPDNLKKVREVEWTFLTQLKSNRKVNPDDSFDRRIENVPISEDSPALHLKGLGLVKVFRTVSTHGDGDDGDGDDEHADKSKTETVQYWATNDLTMTEKNREDLARRAWGVETYHRRLKPYCGAERSQHQSIRAQHNHIQMSIRAFLRLELHRVRTAVSFHELKTAIIRDAIQAYLADPIHVLPSSA